MTVGDVCKEWVVKHSSTLSEGYGEKATRLWKQELASRPISRGTPTKPSKVLRQFRHQPLSQAGAGLVRRLEGVRDQVWRSSVTSAGRRANLLAMNHLQWDKATMTWAPEYTPATSILRVPAFVGGYAGVILQQSLPPAVARLSQGEGDILEVDVRAGKKHGDGERVSFDPGEVAIVADRLTERLNAEGLRRRVDELVNEAVLEGDAWAERDEKRAKRFLEELSLEPPQRG